MKNRIIWIVAVYISVFVNIYSHEEFLKYVANSSSSYDGIEVFATNDYFNSDLLKWTNYNINVHVNYSLNQPTNSEYTYWTDAEKSQLIFYTLNTWDEYGWGNVLFTETSSSNNSINVLFSTSTGLFPPPQGGSQRMAWTSIAVQNNKIVYKRTDTVPNNHHQSTTVYLNNTSNKGFDWVFWNYIEAGGRKYTRISST